MQAATLLYGYRRVEEALELLEQGLKKKKGDFDLLSPYIQILQTLASAGFDGKKYGLCYQYMPICP